MKITKKQLEEIKRLKKKYETYKQLKAEEIIKLERLRKLISRMRDY